MTPVPASIWSVRKALPIPGKSQGPALCRAGERKVVIMTITERAAYLRGLAEGLELDADKKEVKLLNGILELLDDLALSVSDLEVQTGEIADQLDEVDEDLGTLEEEVYGLNDDEDDCDGCCGCEDEDDELDEFDDTYFEVTCPNCGETVCLSADIIEEGEMDCPNCGEHLEFELEEAEEEEDSAEE